MMHSKQRFQSGFSMVELVVAAAVFSMGLGSLSMMMLASIHGTIEARHRTIAITQANSLAEMISMQSDAYGHYINPPGSGSLNCDENTCQGENMAGANMLAWQRHLAAAVPGSIGLVCRDSTPDDGDASNPSCDGRGALVVKVFWTEHRHQDAPDGGQRRAVSTLSW